MLNLKPPPPSYRDLLRKSESKLKLKLKLGLRSEFKLQSGMELEFKPELEYELKLEYQFKITTSLIYIHIYPMSPMSPPCTLRIPSSPSPSSSCCCVNRLQRQRATVLILYELRPPEATCPFLSLFHSLVRLFVRAGEACGRVGV
jgi:hypothetical protein